MATIRMTTPLFIRLLEYAREDAETDIELHEIAECAERANRVLGIEDYEELVPEDEDVERHEKSERENDEGNDVIYRRGQRTWPS